MRTVLDEAGVPVPAYVVVDDGPGRAPTPWRAFAAAHGWPVMLKAARGGYDGKGVWPVARPGRGRGRAGAASRAGSCVEELLPLDAELAVMVARRPSGASAAWPAVETAQVGGVCREVLVPGRLARRRASRPPSALGQKVAEIAGGVGVMAVELFWSGGRLLVNEVATRPHNSGHWTMEGAVTSQFENHVRAVLDLPARVDRARSTPRWPASTSSAAPTGEDPAGLLARGLAVEGAHVHLYGKSARPGRKLGHVTVCGDDAEVVRARAWSAALALGHAGARRLDLPAGVTPVTRPDARWSPSSWGARPTCP